MEFGTKIEIINILKKSLIEKTNHGKIAEWKQLCKGIIKLMEMGIYTDIDKNIAADIIVRISRWYYTVGNIWIGFTPYINKIVKIIWGDIENLYTEYSENVKNS